MYIYIDAAQPTEIQMKEFIIKVQIQGEAGYDLFNVAAKSKSAAIAKMWACLDDVDDGYYAGLSSQAIIIDTFN